MYQENALVKPGGISMRDVPVDLGTIKTPAFFLSTREDHIAPWKATYEGMKRLGGPVTFTLAASGHIAGVINPPAKKKYCYWDNTQTPENPDAWFEKAVQHEGSWWPHWQEWISDFGGKQVAARTPDKGIEPAPGSYVKAKT
jgi:polyhydroxyalkanoate synthase